MYQSYQGGCLCDSGGEGELGCIPSVLIQCVFVCVCVQWSSDSVNDTYADAVLDVVLKLDSKATHFALESKVKRVHEE